MMGARVRVLSIVGLPLLLAGCITDEEIGRYASPGAGMERVANLTLASTNASVALVSNPADAAAIADRVSAMVRGKTISADTAVQVALLNNRGLQAAYADLGISAADVWQETKLPNPRISIGVFGIASPEFGAWRAIEGMVANNILALATMRQRVDLADARFRKAQLDAALATLSLANQTRRAWIDAVGAFETVFYLNQAQRAADAASELALKLGESGALPKAGQAREHAFFAELTGQRAEARLAAKLAKEKLTRLMGLWGADIDYYVPDQLPEMPGSRVDSRSVEAEALHRRVDLQSAKLDLEAEAQAHGLTSATRFVSDFEILAGVETERENELELDTDGAEPELVSTRKTVTTPQVELEFVIPIFDSGEARLRKAELAYMRAANRLAEKAVNVRSEARAAYTAYRATGDIARHYRRSVLPLRQKIEEESLLTYNGMITNTFELLADTRAKINTNLLASDAKRKLWLADAGLNAAIYGGGESSSEATGGMTATAAAEGGGGH